MDTTFQLRSFSPIYLSKYVNICRSPSAKYVCHSDSFFPKASILPCTVDTSLSCPCKNMFSSFNRKKTSAKYATLTTHLSSDKSF